MAEELCTVDDAATRLKLHPKTVLRHIREGRLPARRLGKAYRIRRSDLDAFAGLPAAPDPSPSQEPWVTSIVDAPGVTAKLAQKMAASVTNALNARRGGGLMRTEVVYEPERSHLKIIIVGPPGDTANLLGLIRVWLEQLTP